MPRRRRCTSPCSLHDWLIDWCNTLKIIASARPISFDWLTIDRLIADGIGSPAPRSELCTVSDPTHVTNGTGSTVEASLRRSPSVFGCQRSSSRLPVPRCSAVDRLRRCGLFVLTLLTLMRIRHQPYQRSTSVCSCFSSFFSRNLDRPVSSVFSSQCIGNYY